MTTPEDLMNITKAIQLALAPAFLLTGIAGILNVMTGRLARIIDRGRALTDGPRAAIPSDQGQLLLELQGLEQRRHFTSVAITSCTIAALLLCMVIGALFLEVVLDAPLKWLVGTLFATAMLTLIVGLAFFLREVHSAMQTIHIPIPEDK